MLVLHVDFDTVLNDLNRLLKGVIFTLHFGGDKEDSGCQVEREIKLILQFTRES